VNKEDKKIHIGPNFILIGMIFIVAIMSFILSKFGIGGQKTIIYNENLETVLITVNNIFSIEGIKYFLGTIMTNFKFHSMLINIIVILFGFSICEVSGFFKHIFLPLKKRKNYTITLILIIMCLVTGFLGEYAYIIMLPFSAILYKYTNRSPILGLITAFIAITMSQTFTFIYDYNTYLLGNLTQLSATVNVDKNFKYSFLSSIYINISMTIVFVFLAAYIIESFYKNKYKKIIFEDNKNISSKGIIISLIVLVIFIAGFVYIMLPNNSNFILDNTQEHQIAKLFSSSSIFNQSLIFLISLVMSICGIIYGLISKNIKNTYEIYVSLTSYFDKLSSLFLLTFLSSILVSILTWTNIGEVVSINLVNLLSIIDFSGISLIVIFFIFVIFMTVLIPDSVSKWMLISPIIIPLFMKSNITPEYTQILFKVSDGIGKTITPVFTYFLLLVAFMEKYKPNDDEPITIFGTYRMMIKPILSLAAIIIFIIIGWFIIGIPIGLNVFPTL